MGLLEELKDYRQPNGLYSNQKNPVDDSSGNCIAISSLAMWLAHKLGEFQVKDFWETCADFESSVLKCQVPGYPGLYNRSPTKIGDQDGWDDYICLLAASAKSCLNLMTVLTGILARAWESSFFFNNKNPGKKSFKSFLLRYVQFAAHLDHCVGLKPSFLAYFFWCVGVFFSAFSSNPTTWVLNKMIVDSANTHGLLSCLVTEFWTRRAKHKNMEEAVALWLSVEKDEFGEDLPNFDHPIVKYWRD